MFCGAFLGPHFTKNTSCTLAEWQRKTETGLRILGEKTAHLQTSVGDYPKMVHIRYMKKGRSDTPLS